MEKTNGLLMVVGIILNISPYKKRVVRVTEKIINSQQLMAIELTYTDDASDDSGSNHGKNTGIKLTNGSQNTLSTPYHFSS